jgi:hypothetical protein
MAAVAVRRPPHFPADRELPGADGLLTGSGEARVARFLEERGLEPHRVEPAQAHYRAGRWLAVCFRTGAVERSSGRPVCPTVTVECRAGEPDMVWAFPDDPTLPGLAVAADGHVVRRVLRPSPNRLTVEPLRYRPRRRAVLRYLLDGGEVLFGKVVAPRRARRLLAVADAVRSTGPACETGGPAAGAPISLAFPTRSLGRGALVLPTLPGRDLRGLLLDGRAVPAPDRVARLLESVHRHCQPALAERGPSDDRGSMRRQVDPGTALCAARLMARLLPEEACTAGRVAEAVTHRADASEPPEPRIVHGDLYEAQILVDGDRLGLLDLDDLGPGDPLLDAANFCAHLLILGACGPPAPAVLGYREELRAAFLRLLDADPAELDWREAYCLLRLASGPFRVLHPDWPRRTAARLALATDVLSVRR